MARPTASVEVDFSNANVRNPLPEDDYDAEVEDCTIEISQQDNKYLKWIFKVSEGEHAGAKVYHNSVLVEQSLWALRNVLVALGVEVPAGKMQLTPTKYVGRSCRISVVQREYQGKKRPQIVDFAPLSAVVANDNESMEVLEDVDL